MTDCYCEENVYRYLASSANDRNRAFAVFISNEAKTVVLRQQRAAEKHAVIDGDTHYTVIWDYHVVAVEFSGEEWVVVDRDSRLETPFPLQAYCDQTFPRNVVPEFKSRFRVVPSAIFLDNFASDRSHMIIPPDQSEMDSSNRGDGDPQPIQYHAPPPNYPPIIGDTARQRGETNNLFSNFLDMSLPDNLSIPGEEGRYGVVLDSVEELCNYMTQSHYFLDLSRERR